MNDTANERRAKRFWITFVIGLMGLQTAIGATAITLSVNSPSSAVVPNYYSEAMKWDQSKAKYLQFSSNQWDLDLVAEPVTQAGIRLISIKLVDEQGLGVSGLDIHCRTFHHANGRHPITFSFTEEAPGRYVAAGPLVRPGLWEFELSIHGDNESAYRQTLELQ